MTEFSQNLRRHLMSDEALDNLVAYFNPEQRRSGREFVRYGAGRADPYAITGDDLVAVTFLSMEIRAGTKSGISPTAAIVLESSKQVESILKRLDDRLDDKTSLHELSRSQADATLLTPDSPGWQLWDFVFQALRDSGKGRGTDKCAATFKLLARKRTHLFPLRDTQLVKLLGNPSGWWEAWWFALQDSVIVERLDQLRADAALPTESLLRIDAALWKPKRAATP